MPTLSPWTRLRRKLDPLVLELHRASPWRVEDVGSVESWLKNLTWWDLWWGDVACESLCSENPRLSSWPVPMTIALDDSDEFAQLQDKVRQQVMHRLLFAIDLSKRMPNAYRKDHKLTGNLANDARQILIFAWRTSTATKWASRFGHEYLGESV